MRRPLTALVILLGVGLSSAAWAQYDFVGVRALGQGEAMRATATGAEGPLLNPSGMSLLKQYTIEAMYGINIENVGHHVNVSLVDSVTSRVAAGLFYSFIYAQPKVAFNWAGGFQPTTQLTRTGHAAGLSLSVPLGDKFILGATAKYLHFDTTAPLPNAVPNTLTFDSVNGVTFDIGLTLRLGEKFRIAAVGYNLWDHGSRESPLSLGLAVGINPIPQLTINFDAVINFTGFQTFAVDPMTGKISLTNRITGRLGPGLEWLVGSKVPIRAGVVYDSGLPGTFLTAGLGYVSPQFGVDLSYRGKVQGGIENVLMLGLRLFID
jgi:hypothetical protein